MKKIVIAVTLAIMIFSFFVLRYGGDKIALPDNEMNTDMKGSVSVLLEDKPQINQIQEFSPLQPLSTYDDRNHSFRVYEYIYTTLSDEKKEAYRDIVNAIEAHKEETFCEVDFSELLLICTVDLSKYQLTYEDIVFTYWSVLDDYIPYFFIDGSAYAYVSSDGSEKILYVMADPKYKSPNARQVVYNALNYNISCISELIGNESSSAKKAQIICDYIVEKYSYANDENNNPIISTDTLMISGIVDSKGVCAGYSKIFSFLCNQFDIPTIYVKGDVPGGYHAWNYSYLSDDNCWYASDITYTDSGSVHFLCGKSILSTHVPDYENNSKVFCYPLPMLADNDFIFHENSNNESDNEISHSDLNSNIDSDESGRESNISAEVVDKDDAGESDVHEDEFYNDASHNNNVSDESDFIVKEWSEWLDALPSDINGNNAYIEMKTQYAYHLPNDVIYTDSMSDELVSQGYKLTNTSYSDWGEWSSYTESKPVESDLLKSEEITLYRYRDKVTTESGESSLSGWINDGYYTVTGDFSQWTDQYIEGSSTREVETQNVEDLNNPIYETYYRYSRYSIHGSDNQWHTGPTAASISYWGGKPSCTYSEWSTERKPYYKQSNAGCPMYGDASHHWYNEESTQNVVGYNTKTQYRYRDTSVVYKYYKITDWSEFSDVPVNASDTREVETATNYRYKTRSVQYTYLKEGDWTEWTENEMDTDLYDDIRFKDLYRYRLK